MITTILIGSSAILLALTLLPFSTQRWWWIRGLDFPRLQIAAVAMAVGIGSIWSGLPGREHALVGSLLLATLVVQLAHIIPYTFLYKKQVKRSTQSNPRNSFSMMVANVFMPNRNASGLLDVVRRQNPDLLLLMEPNDWWHEQLRVLWPDFPYRVCRPQSNTYGMELFSRLELLSPKVEERVEPGIPSISTRLKLRSGTEVELRCVHPKPPAPQEAASSLPRDAELLLVGREVADFKMPVVVAGDLNDVAWSHSTRLFQRVSHLLDPRRGRWLFNSYNAKIPFVRWPLDHFFHSHHFTLDEIKRLPAMGSDHFPMFIKLNYEPKAVSEQPTPKPDSADMKETRDVISEAKFSVKTDPEYQA
jgi:endonuclease/exonuclease/phosphatase (EEP) superfamily protein YafD